MPNQGCKLIVRAAGRWPLTGTATPACGDGCGDLRATMAGSRMTIGLISIGLISIGLIALLISPASAQQRRGQPPSGGGERRSATGQPATGQPPAGRPPAGERPAAEPFSPDSAQAALVLYTDAANFQNSGAFDLAKQRWQQLIEKFPTDPLRGRAEHYLGLCYMLQPDPDIAQAERWLDASASGPATDVRPETLLNLGWARYTLASRQAEPSAAELEAARGTLATFLREYPTHPRRDQALYFIAASELGLGRIDSAVKFYQRVVDEGGPTSPASSFRPEAIHALGVCYQQLGEGPRSERLLGEFLQSYPQHRLADDAKLRLAELRLVEQDWQGGLDRLRPLLSGQPGAMHDYILYRAGYALTQLGDNQQAATYFQQLLADYPGSPYAPAAGLAAGQARWQQGDSSSAAAHFERLLESTAGPIAGEAAYWLGQLAIAERDWERAEALARRGLRQLGEADPDSGGRWQQALQLQLAEALLEQNRDSSEARKLFEQVAEQPPLGADGRALLARATYNAAFMALEQGDAAATIAWADRFAERFPTAELGLETALLGAEACLRVGEFDAAAERLAALRAAEPQHPQSGDWTLRQASALRSAGKLTEAVQLLRDSAAQLAGPLREEADQLLGLSLLGLGEAGPAADALRAALEQAEQKLDQAAAGVGTEPLAERVAELRLQAATALEAAGQWSDAVNMVRPLAAAPVGSPMRELGMFRTGQLLSDARQWSDARAAYRQLMEDPQGGELAPYARYGLAWIDLQQEKFDVALRQFLELTETVEDPEVVEESLLASGICLRRLGRLPESRQQLERLLGLEPPEPTRQSGQHELGLTLLALDEHGAGQQLLAEVADRWPDYDQRQDLLLELARSYQLHRQTESAEVRYRQLLEQYPESPAAGQASYALGQIAFGKQDYQAAATFFETTWQANRGQPLADEALYRLGWSLFRQERWQAALERFAMLAAEDGSQAFKTEAAFMQGECQWRLEDRPAALQSYRQARECLEGGAKTIGPAVPVLVHLHAAQVLGELERWAEMEPWLQVILDRYSDTSYLPQTLFELATSRQQQGELEEAIRLFGQVAGNYRNAIGARARFMIGQIRFGLQDYAQALPEFQQVMFGYGGLQAEDDIRPWQARSAMEAGRCAELLIGQLDGEQRSRAVSVARDFYQYIIDHHNQSEMAAAAARRIEELKKL
jgi:cellulose synthase operon protein C